MYYAAAQQMTTARHIARSASQQIKEKTGMQMTVLLYPAETTLKTPEQMLKVIALALDMIPESYRARTRVRNIVEMRFIAALLLRSNFPRLTLCQIAALFGGQDHSSVVNGLASAYNLIHTGNIDFIKKYNTALKAANQWLKTEE